MNTSKLTAVFAALSMMTGIAMAQPAQQTPAAQTPAVQAPAGDPAMSPQENQRPRQGKKAKQDKKGKKGKKDNARQDRRANRGGPYSMLHAATELESLDTEQKQKIDAYIEENKPQAEALRKEMGAAMQQARQSTDPQARRNAMQSIRQKSQAIQQDVNKFLGEVLKPDQLQELKKAAPAPRGQGRNPNRPADNAMQQSPNAAQQPANTTQQPANTNMATTATQSVNPFSTQ